VFAEVRSAVATLEGLARELDPLLVDGSDAASLLEDVARGERVCAAMKALLARRVDECGVWKQSGHRSAAHWLADRTGVALSSAVRSLDTARDLDALPETAVAFRAGDLSELQAHEITEAARMDPSAETALLATAAQQSSVKGLRDACRQVRAVAIVDDAAHARDLHLNRSHTSWTERDGAVCGRYRLAPDSGARFRVALRDHEDRIFKEAYKAGRRERREAYSADALLALAEQGPCKPVQLKVTADHAALARGYVEPGERCEIDGIGPIPVTVARAMLDDAVVTVFGREGNGLTTYSSPKRTIPAHLARALETAHPKCGRRACANDQYLQRDHIVPVEEGGPTTMDNLWRLCPYCHNLKTYMGWKVIGTPGHWDLVPPDDADPPPQPEERVLQLVAPGPP
jgi:hypothetical protein